MPLPRVQLFEVEDQRWFPRVVRDFATDYLRFASERFALHAPIVPLLTAALARSRSTRIIDLCSGGTGPVPALVRALRAQGVGVEVVLTDLYPNRAAFAEVAADAARSGGSVTWMDEPVDARAVPATLTGLRTIFNGFHHFRPDDAIEALRDAARCRQPIAIFEYPDRRLRLLPAFALLTPLAVLAVTPWIRPFRWERLLWTYLVPLVPLTCWWDGMVSTLRAYTPDELAALAAATHAEDYAWQSGRVAVTSPPCRLTYLLGWPTSP
ncbi:MAG: hypothetical protein MUE41_16210 [Gemmatimonadaceae bacterium]|jgi:hypothetical protein|nr:hypothetical protein [Gemmatimonadaceae bacterium]